MLVKYTVNDCKRDIRADQKPVAKSKNPQTLKNFTFHYFNKFVSLSYIFFLFESAPVLEFYNMLASSKVYNSSAYSTVHCTV